jgi:hypothetical protein
MVRGGWSDEEGSAAGMRVVRGGMSDEEG